MTDITQFFPITDKIKEPRLQQIKLSNDIIELFKSGKKQIEICAPTGIGKSPLAVLLANAFASHGKRTLITSPLNELVDQYDADFGEQYLSTIKGRKHYTCNANPDRTCDIGYCQEKVCGIDQTQRLCQNVATADLCKRRDECPCMRCEYISAMKTYKASSKGNTNFTLFQKGVTNDPDLIIIDEADSVEDFVRMNFSVTVPEIIDWDNFSDHIFSLQDWKDIYQKNIETATHHMQNSKNPHQRMELSRTIKSLKSKCVNVSRIIDDYNKHGEDWAVTNNDFKGTTLYQPVLTDRFLEPLLKNKYVIQMSATPPNLPNYEYLEVDSPFPPEIRQWKYKPLGRMSLKYREQTIPKVSKFLCSLEGKTLVHCVSYATAEAIGRSIMSLCNRTPLIQTGKKLPYDYNCSGLVGRVDAVERFKKSDNPNEILLSVKMDRGVDFWENDITNNVICVMPWPNPTDPVVKAKNKLLGESWKNQNMANIIMQSYGRINRNANKTTMTYIIDTNFGSWFGKNKSCFKKWYLEAQVK